ncbi:MAG TPA: lamin tail domain-containing protein [Tepidisphaeraceae bacterium]|nr:lamin tail domain-containing protein [Tepidisphaeraceae bacterium]
MVRVVALTSAVLFASVMSPMGSTTVAAPAGKAMPKQPPAEPPAAVAPAAPAAKLVVTEIMYDPLSSESDDKQTEWIEIQNVGGESANLQGYQLTSGSKQKPHDPKQRFVIGNVSVPPGGRAVVGVGSAESYEGLGLPTFAAYAGEAKFAWLTNNGDAVAIRDAKGKVIDEVIYATEAPWPVIKSSGSSIQFVAPPGEDPATANDDPKNWTASDSTNAETFEKHGHGTPGAGPTGDATVATTAPATRPAKPIAQRPAARPARPAQATR